MLQISETMSGFNLKASHSWASSMSDHSSLDNITVFSKGEAFAVNLPVLAAASPMIR
jgi:hypothetical protein